ncbi:LPXTG cell wall anchor domain-containing protein, partial [Enterococcus pallens]
SDSDSDSDSDIGKKLPTTGNNSGTANNTTSKNLPKTNSEEETIKYAISGIGLVGLGVTFYSTSRRKKRNDGKENG